MNGLLLDVSKRILLDLAERSDVSYIQYDLDPFITMDVTPGSAIESAQSANSSEPGLLAIKADKLWKRGYTGRNRKVMTMDSGFNPFHPALRQQFLGNYMPMAQCWAIPNASPRDCDASTTHGSHVTGIEVGLDRLNNDTIGVAFNAKVIGAGVICTAAPISTIQAFQWAMNPDGDTTTTSDMPDAINNSWGGGVQSECTSAYVQLLSALETAGIAVVFSAGNNGPTASSITSPKNINTDTVNVFCVGNVNPTAPYAIASSSSRGPSTCGGAGTLLIKPEVAAPGTNIRSISKATGYQNLTGTSMASPHATGSIALLKEAFPTATGTQIKMALFKTATDLGAVGEDNNYGMGLINLDSAFKLLSERFQPVPPPTNAYDIVLQEVLSPLPYVCDSIITPKILVVNKGDSSINGFTAYCQPAGGPRYSVSVPASLASGASTVVSFPAISAAGYAVQTLYFSMSTANAEIDTFNNRKVWRFGKLKTATLPYNESFTSGLSGSKVIIHNPDSLFPIVAANVGGTSPTGQALQFGFRTNVIRTDREYAFLPSINRSQAGGSLMLRFQYAYRNFSPNRKDSLIIRLVTDCQSKGSVIWAKSDSDLASLTPSNTAFTPSLASHWKSDSIDLSNLVQAGQSFSIYFEGYNDNGNNLYVDNISISQTSVLPVAGFTASSVAGCMPRTINLVSTALSADTTYFILPGGMQALGTSAAFVANQAGNYTVKQVVINAFGIDSISRVISVNPSPTAGFSTNDTLIRLGVGNQAVQFNNQSQNASSYSWNFGDNTTSILPNPTKYYTQAGSYTVRLVASIPGCSDTMIKTAYIRVVSGAKAGFNVNVPSGCLPKTVSLISTALSADTVVFSLPNGSSTTGTSATYTITQGGSYTFAQRVSGMSGVDTISKTIQIDPNPRAMFSTTDTLIFLGSANQQVQFTNTSQFATAYTWDFGDGTSSTLTQPTKVYGTNGLFTISLIAANGSCTDTLVKPDLVHVTISAGVGNISKSDFVLFPNPANDRLFINGPLESIQHISILDVEGRIKHSFSKWSGGSLDLGTLSDGVYVLRIQTNEGILNLRFCKQ